MKLLLEDSLLLIWNNRNSAERLRLMEETYAPGIRFFEGHDAEPFVGFAAIDELIGKLQSGWPGDFVFSVIKVDFNHDVQHISWTLGSPGQEPAARGMDVAVVVDGKIGSLYLFLE